MAPAFSSPSSSLLSLPTNLALTLERRITKPDYWNNKVDRAQLMALSLAIAEEFRSIDL
jgi:hypothetical protein